MSFFRKKSTFSYIFTFFGHFPEQKLHHFVHRPHKSLDSDLFVSEVEFLYSLKEFLNFVFVHDA